VRVVSVDSETFLIAPGMLCPRLVCVSMTERASGRLLTYLLNAAEGLRVVRELLSDRDVMLVTHNGPFDYGVFCAEDPTLIPLVFAAYEAGRCRDTLTRQKLYDIAMGFTKFHSAQGERRKTGYHLADLVQRHFGRVLPKGGDTYRLRYGELVNTSIKDYPRAASEYAMRDAEETYLVWEAQETLVTDDVVPKTMPDEIPQTCAAWALHLMSVWGLRTDPVSTFAFRERLMLEMAELRKRLQEFGLVRPATGKKPPSKNMAAIRERILARCQEINYPIKYTDGGAVATDGDLLDELIEAGEMDLPLEKRSPLAVLKRANEVEWELSNWVPVLLKGVELPITTRYNSPLDTGRVSTADPNIMNPPRKGDVRGCFVPRPGRVFVFCDLDTAEMRSWAQVCFTMFGASDLRDILIRDEDPHLALGAELLGISYAEMEARYKAGDEVAVDARQFAKIPNFGLPGGMGPDAFVAYARGYGYKITRERAVEVIRAWKRRLSESTRYFQRITNHLDMSSTIEQLFSGRIRGGVRFTQACNGYFQSLTADMIKAAMWKVSKECYLPPVPGAKESPLYGSRLVIFLHDELGLEAPEAKASGAARRLQEIMVNEGRNWTPDVPTKATAVITRRWYKGAKAIRSAAGDLLPVRPVVEGKKTSWVVDGAAA
jgi:hypothetical protein